MYESGKQSGSWTSLLAVDTVTGQTALHVAAANPSLCPDQLEILWILLQAGVKVEALDKLGHSCVTLAAMAGNTIGMSVILEHMLFQPQGPLNAQSLLTSCDEFNHFDVLVHAVLADRKESVLSLLGDYEYCHVQEARYCPTARNILHLAAVNGSTNALEALLKLCFEDIVSLCNAADRNGFMPLAYAAANCTRRHLRDGRLPKCFMPSSTATPSVESNINNLSALLEALQVPIDALHNGGANVAIVSNLNPDSRTWSTLVCDPRCTRDVNCCIHSEFVVALLETGLVDVNQLHGLGPEGGVSSLFLASLYGHIPVVHALLENGAKQDCGAYTPMQAAAATNNRALVELLLTHNADNSKRFMMERPVCFSGTHKLEDSPLTIAIANSSSIEELEPFLSDEGPVITGEDIQLAIISGQEELVKTLINVGGSPLAPSEQYGRMSALATAVDLDNLPMLRLILEHVSVLSEAVDHQGRNILHHVCELGRSNALLMIQEELDTHFPYEHERKEELRLLIRPIAGLPNGRASPLEIAARQDSSPCYKILQSYLQESGFSKSELIASASPQSYEKAAIDPKAPLSNSTASMGSTAPKAGKKAKAAASKRGNDGKRKGASSSQDYMNLTHSQQVGMDTLKKAVSAKLADFVASHSGRGQLRSSEFIADIPGITDDVLSSKLEGLLKWLVNAPDPTAYFKVLHGAQQHKRVSAALLEMNIVDICLNESLKSTNPLNMQNWLRTLALLHRNDTPFLDKHTLNLVVKLLSHPLFMETSKAQAYLMVTINNECAAHPQVSNLIVNKLSDRDNKTALLRFFSCCIRTVQDDEASPAGIGLLDLFTHIFLKEDSFADSYCRVMTNLVNAPSALACIIQSLNSLYTKAIDMTASLRMLQRVAQYFPVRVVLAGALLPLLRLSTARPSDPLGAATTISAHGAFSDLLKFANLPLQKLLWKVMRHSLFIDLGLTSPALEARTAACDAIVCLCRDSSIQQQLIADPKYFDMLLKLFGSLVPSMKPNGHIGEGEALTMRECLLALSFLWNQDPARITAALSIPNALELLLALYHTDGVSAVASRVIQIIWAHDPQQCQSLLSSSPLTIRLYQSFAEKSGFTVSPSQLLPLQHVEPFAVPKWYTHADGVLHEDLDAVTTCAYCGVSDSAKSLVEQSKGKRYCSPECQNADATSN